jgi:hypothetical protein
MPTPPVTPEKQAEIEDLERAIRRAIDEEIGELAANLATTDDAHLFGDNEFKIRALAHKIAAKALEQHLAQKKQRSDTELGSTFPKIRAVESITSQFNSIAYY